MGISNGIWRVGHTGTGWPFADMLTESKIS
jgi:hypothetical protein